MLDKNRVRLLKEFQSRLGYRARRISLLNEALTHKSFVNEFKDKNLSDNERLEFLGDAVLGIVISDYLYARFKDFDEGRLSKFRSNLVNKDTLFNIAKRIDLGKYLLLGRGEILSGGNLQLSNLTSGMEAVLGAIFLDRGFKYTYKIIVKLFSREISEAEKGKLDIDFKSMLQEYALKKFRVIPAYKVISETGPGHRREFEVVVNVGESEYGRAKGFSKKSAQQDAAKEALKNLKAV